jgi:two-component system, cell cycle response regulator DivK
MSIRILIVEDEADNMVLLVHILKFVLNQDNLVTAANGHEAIRLAHDMTPDLILMDLTLPKLTGWEATRSLRVSPQFKQTKIIALTAHAMVGDKEKAIEAGCDDYFPKPIDIERFIGFIQPYLAERAVVEVSPVSVAQAGTSKGDAENKPVPLTNEIPHNGPLDVPAANEILKTNENNAPLLENKPTPLADKPAGAVETQPESSIKVSANDDGNAKNIAADKIDK